MVLSEKQPKRNLKGYKIIIIILLFITCVFIYLYYDAMLDNADKTQKMFSFEKKVIGIMNCEGLANFSTNQDIMQIFGDDILQAEKNQGCK